MKKYGNKNIDKWVYPKPTINWSSSFVQSCHFFLGISYMSNNSLIFLALWFLPGCWCLSKTFEFRGIVFLILLQKVIVSAVTAEYGACKGLFLSRVLWWTCPTDGHEENSCNLHWTRLASFQQCISSAILTIKLNLHLLSCVNYPLKIFLNFVQMFSWHFSISRNAFFNIFHSS